MQDQIRFLAAVRSEAVPVLSVYVDMRPHATGGRRGERDGLIVLKDRRRAIEKALLPRGPALDAFRADAERVERYLDEAVLPEAQGVAIFAAIDRGIFETVVAGVPFETEATFAPTFDLFQLARLADDQETAVVAVVDTNTARLFVMRLGQFSEVDGPNDDPYWYSQRQHVGPNKLRFQRHTAMKRRQFAQEVVTALDDLVTQEGATRVILAGDEVALPVLRAELSPEISDLVVADALRLDIRASRTAIVERVEPTLAQAEAEQELSLGDEVLEAAQAGGLGVVGADATYRSLLRGQVDVLVLEDQVDLAAGQRNTMIRQAALTGATVEVLAAHPNLSEWGGVGALLRYRLDDDVSLPDDAIPFS